MSDFSLSYREIIPDLTQPKKWKEFALNTGKCHNLRLYDQELRLYF